MNPWTFKKTLEFASGVRRSFPKRRFSRVGAQGKSLKTLVTAN